MELLKLGNLEEGSFRVETQTSKSSVGRGETNTSEKEGATQMVLVSLIGAP